MAERAGSLIGRVALAVGLVLALGGIAVLGAARTYGWRAAQEAYDRLLLAAAHDIADAITIRNGAAVVDIPYGAFEILALAPEDRIRWRVVGPGGVTLTGDETLPLPDLRGDRVFFDHPFGAEPARHVVVTRRFAERSFSGPVRVVLGQTLRARAALAGDITRRTGLAVIGAGAAMGLVAWGAVRSALRPLSRMVAALAARDPQDLTPFAIRRPPREIAGVLAALNGFMARLDRQMQANRDLIGDTAHQLRTPVAALRAESELAATAPPPEARARAVQIHARARALGHLLDQLLARAMVIHRADQGQMGPVDLRDVALDLLEMAEADLHPPPGALRLSLPEAPVRVRGDALSLHEAGRNLLANALAHGQPPVLLGVAEGRLFVRDAGPGPSDALMERLGTRFAGQARGPGGLGLAIAQEVALRHGGTLEARRLAPGFEVALVLPGVRG